MPQPAFPASKLRKLLLRCVADNFDKAHTANPLRIARSTATKYVNAFRRSALTLSDIENVRSADLAVLLFPDSNQLTLSPRKIQLLARLPSVHSRIEHDGLSVLDVWRDEVASNQCSYKYTQFASMYAGWRLESGLPPRSRAGKSSVSIKPIDYEVLKSWQRSHDRRKWEVSIALLGLAAGLTVSELCRKIGRERRTVNKWRLAYERAGIDGLPIKRSTAGRPNGSVQKRKRSLVDARGPRRKLYPARALLFWGLRQSMLSSRGGTSPAMLIASQAEVVFGAAKKLTA
jgi:transposase-like protein